MADEKELVTLEVGKIKELVDEGTKKALADSKQFHRKANFTGREEDQEKAKKQDAIVNVFKFFNAAKNNDAKTAQAIAEQSWINKMGQEKFMRFKALNEASGAAGGFLVPVEFEAEVIKSMDDFSEIRRDARVVKMNTLTKDLNTLLTKVTVAKKAEMDHITGSQPTFGEPILTAEMYVGSTTMSEELEEDSEINVMSELAAEYGEQFAYAEQESFLNSSVSGSEGILQISGVRTLNLITGAGFDDISFDDLAAMQADIGGNYNKGEAKRGSFYMGWDSYNELRTSKPTGGDGHYFVMPNVPTEDAPAMAWGRPVVILNEFASPTGAGTKIAFFADLKRHFVIGDRRGLEMKINTSGTAADGTNLNRSLASELVVSKRTAQLVTLPGGITCLVS